MGTVDWSLLPPSPWTDEERSELVRTAAEENRARRGYNLSLEECHRILEPWVAEADAKRGYKLTPEQKERRIFQYVFEARIVEARRRAAAAAEPFEYRYRPPRGPLVVREGQRGETQLDRIERALSATRVQLEALESKVTTFVDQNIDIARKLDALVVRVEALTETVERIDLRVLSLENRVGRLEDRMERLEARVQRLEARVQRLEGAKDS
jgi:chaperonin cofactor prefoldin